MHFPQLGLEDIADIQVEWNFQAMLDDLHSNYGTHDLEEVFVSGILCPFLRLHEWVFDFHSWSPLVVASEECFWWNPPVVECILVDLEDNCSEDLVVASEMGKMQDHLEHKVDPEDKVDPGGQVGNSGFHHLAEDHDAEGFAEEIVCEPAYVDLEMNISVCGLQVVEVLDDILL